MGFLAEEVGRIVPEVVGFEDANNVSNWYIDSATGEKTLYATGLDYGALTPMLVEAIKGQNELVNSNSIGINNLAADINNLKTENEKLKSQVDELKEQIDAIRKGMSLSG